MNIDWKSRIKNKTFWVTLIPTLLLAIQAIAKVFGFELDFGVLSDNLINAIEVIFVLLAVLGVVIDTKTEGLSD